MANGGSLHRILSVPSSERIFGVGSSFCFFPHLIEETEWHQPHVGVNNCNIPKCVSKIIDRYNQIKSVLCITNPQIKKSIFVKLFFPKTDETNLFVINNGLVVSYNRPFAKPERQVIGGIVPIIPYTYYHNNPAGIL